MIFIDYKLHMSLLHGYTFKKIELKFGTVHSLISFL